MGSSLGYTLRRHLKLLFRDGQSASDPPRSGLDVSEPRGGPLALRGRALST